MILRRLAYGFSSVALSVSSLFVLASPVAHAAAVAWDGEGADTNFSTAANWVGDVVPGNGDVLVFDAANLPLNPSLNNDLTSLDIAGIQLSGSSGAPANSVLLVIRGNAFTISGAISNTSDVALSVMPSSLILGTDLIVSGSGEVSFGSESITSTLNLSGHNISASSLYLYGQVIGAGNISADGTILGLYDNTNSFTGDITVSNGAKLEIHGASSLGNAANSITFNGTSKLVAYLNAGEVVGNDMVLNSANTENVLEIRAYNGGAIGFSGAISLAQNAKVLTGSAIVTLTGALSGLYTIAPVAGYTGKLVVNASSNTSSTPNGEYASSVGPIEVTDKQPATNVTVAADQVVVIKDTGERGVITLSGGTLKGTGTVGAVSMSSGKVAPGLSPGILNTGNLVFTGGTLEIEIGGATAGNGDGFHDQTNVTGTVDLGANVTTLTTSLWNNFAPTVGQSYTIINNDSNDAVTGTFIGMADDSSFTQSGVTYSINYNGGDGNDVVLTVTAIPATVTAPNTGFEHLSHNPLLTFVSTLGIVVAIGAIARKQLKSVK